MNKLQRPNALVVGSLTTLLVTNVVTGICAWKAKAKHVQLVESGVRDKRVYAKEIGKAFLPAVACLGTASIGTVIGAGIIAKKLAALKSIGEVIEDCRSDNYCANYYDELSDGYNLEDPEKNVLNIISAESLIKYGVKKNGSISLNEIADMIGKPRKPEGYIYGITRKSLRENDIIFDKEKYSEFFGCKRGSTCGINPDVIRRLY